ncbi:MAG: MarR family transcriptional regulator [Candidatus Pseudobacter hemicellulosilyticus]|uniref:MarR family transcriptional regulator n=1 Tax=Candidatus Pseudobacter hemicellulosilyticus TaxID=3121375 RepID=A0AAJ5WLW3_9BACT|nr:MAG: MarR family transcriptional regulator [Pseudobacter sp.]
MKRSTDYEHVRNLIDSLHQVRLQMKLFTQRNLREYKVDITYEMLQVLSLLWRRGGLNQQEIADSLQKNKASITPLINNLSSRKLVTRAEDPSDRRNKIISLTKSGQEFKQKLEPLYHEFLDRMTKGISLADFRQATELLQKIDANLK